MSEKVLVTSGLPYANGSIHLGHLVEVLQTDILVRYLRMSGKDAIYVCADDAHGTPIELNAQKQGMKPEELIARSYKEHQADFSDFHVKFDVYHTTHSPENRKFAELVYLKLQEGGHVTSREIKQLYCENDKRFLPDRFISGTCPHCKATDQYGDICESCGRTYGTDEVIDPRCSLCGSKPVYKKSEHYFVQLKNFQEDLQAWVNEPGRLQSSTRNYVQRWLDDGLRDWDISRDGPYFGFEIPGTENKFFYVWLDAPIGYISSTARYCEDKGLSFDDYWKNPETEIIHVIGKDIVYFHTLFWPAMLKGSGFRLPSKVLVHGMLTVNGTKMSKSKGTFINARTYLDFLDPQYLRFYYASKLTGGDDDLDLNFQDFTEKVNADLINNITNLISRVVPFTHKHFDGKVSKIGQEEIDLELIKEIKSRIPTVHKHYKSYAFHHAVREICGITTLANKYFQDAAPWALLKTDRERGQAVCSLAINVCRSVVALLKPILPKLAEDVEGVLNVKPLTFDDALAFDLEDHQLNPFKRLVERIDPKAIEKLIEASKENLKSAEEKEAEGSEGSKREPIGEMITIDDFLKVDLRVARIDSAELVEKAKKLLKLTVDVGAGDTRTIFAGIRKSFPEPEVLVGKQVVIVANLKPRKMRFGLSEAMVIATGPSDTELVLTEVPAPAKPGDRIG